MGNEWAVVAAGVGTAAVTGFFAWVIDQSRRKGDREMRAEQANADAEQHRRALYGAIADAAGVVLWSFDNAVSVPARQRLLAALIRVSLEGEPAPAACAAEWANQLSAADAVSRSDLIEWMQRFRESCGETRNTQTH